mmetsp:Transcript_90006/g.176212  ORF Transcript_90006/g.176212 Transcript_90006/m.176212 type:complete len:126 (+) Transcript_90006:260-637(+)
MVVAWKLPKVVQGSPEAFDASGRRVSPKISGCWVVTVLAPAVFGDLRQCCLRRPTLPLHLLWNQYPQYQEQNTITFPTIYSSFLLQLDFQPLQAVTTILTLHSNSIFSTVDLNSQYGFCSEVLSC